MGYSGAWGKLIHEKNLKIKISCHTTFYTCPPSSTSTAIEQFLETFKETSARVFDLKRHRLGAFGLKGNSKGARLGQVWHADARCAKAISGVRTLYWTVNYENFYMRQRIWNFCSAGYVSRSHACFSNAEVMQEAFERAVIILHNSNGRFGFTIFSSPLCTLPSLLCTLPSVLCTLPSVLCTLPTVLCMGRRPPPAVRDQKRFMYRLLTRGGQPMVFSESDIR